MPYCRLYCHLVWATKSREPVLIGELAKVAERSLRETCRNQKAMVHALFVMPDHVHLAVSVPPSLAVATLVSRLMGSSSHLLNHVCAADDQKFAWQSEYGALSFGEKQLKDVVAYIQNQPRRHADRQIWDKLEQSADDSEPASAGFVEVSTGV